MSRLRESDKNLTVEQLRLILRYDEDTGNFYWLNYRPGVQLYKPAGHRHVGPRSNCIYIRITIDGIRYWAHDLAWLYVYGVWPEKTLDHKDIDGMNNRISNLREADDSQNQVNTRVFRNNTSGCTGVTKRFGKWSAKIEWRKTIYQLGTYAKYEDAVAARKKAEIEFFGEFAP